MFVLDLSYYDNMYYFHQVIYDICLFKLLSCSRLSSSCWVICRGIYDSDFGLFIPCENSLVARSATYLGV